MSCLFGNPKISEDIRISFDVSRYPLVSRILTGDPEPRSGYVTFWPNESDGTKFSPCFYIGLSLSDTFAKSLLSKNGYFIGF